MCLNNRPRHTFIDYRLIYVKNSRIPSCHSWFINAMQRHKKVNLILTIPLIFMQIIIYLYIRNHSIWLNHSSIKSLTILTLFFSNFFFQVHQKHVWWKKLLYWLISMSIMYDFVHWTKQVAQIFTKYFCVQLARSSSIAIRISFKLRKFAVLYFEQFFVATTWTCL